MYCGECGNRLMGIEKYCPNCGHNVDDKQASVIENSDSNDNNKSTEGSGTASIVLGTLSLCGVFFVIFAPAALILSIIGLALAIKSNKNAKNTVGIVLNAIGLFLSVAITAVLALMIYLTVDVVKNGDDNMINKYIENQAIDSNCGEDF